MTKDQALKMALEAIETYSPEYMHGLPKNIYIKSIKEALAQSTEDDDSCYGDERFYAND